MSDKQHGMAVVGAFVIQPFMTITGNTKLYWQQQKTHS